jgi:hypothetical protein
MLVPPKIIKPLKDAEVIEGESLNLTCEVYGIPTPNSKW